MEIGESVRQGDVLLIRVKELPIGYEKFPTDPRYFADRAATELRKKWKT